MNKTLKVTLGVLGLGVLGLGFFYGRKAYIRKQTTSANPQKNERVIKTVVKP